MSRISKLSALVVAGGAASVLVAACGSSGGTNTSTVNQPQSSGGSTAQDVAMRSTSLGNVLTAASGRTLYALTANGKDVPCKGECASFWPPLIATSGTPQAASGVTGSLAVVSRGSDKQVTIAGHPLYTYSGDNAAGQTNGEGMQTFGGTWYALNASGALVTGSGSSGGAASSSSNPYNY